MPRKFRDVEVTPLRDGLSSPSEAKGGWSAWRGHGDGYGRKEQRTRVANCEDLSFIAVSMLRVLESEKDPKVG